MFEVTSYHYIGASHIKTLPKNVCLKHHHHHHHHCFYHHHHHPHHHFRLHHHNFLAPWRPTCLRSFRMKITLKNHHRLYQNHHYHHNLYHHRHNHHFHKKIISAPFLTPEETKILVLLSPSVERFGVSRMQDFCYTLDL